MLANEIQTPASGTAEQSQVSRRIATSERRVLVNSAIKSQVPDHTDANDIRSYVSTSDQDPSHGQIRGFPGDLSLGIAFPGDMSPEISGTEKLEWDTFPSVIPGRQRRAHIVSVKQLSATVKAFPGRHVARDAKIN
ncbi:hypothetical protein Tco_0826799 [Tanacetum coccineum]